LYFFIGIPAFLQSEFSLTPAGTKNAGQVRGANDFPGALQYFRKALALLEPLAKTDPANESHRIQIASSHRSMGAVLSMQKEWAGALEEYHVVLPMDEVQLARKPESVSAKRDLSVSYSNTGFILVRQGDLHDGLQYYLKALTLRTALAATDANDTGAQYLLSYTYDYIGGILEQKGNFQQGIKDVKKSLAIREAVLRKDPVNDSYRIAVADCQASMGRVYSELAASRNVTPAQKLVYCRECVRWLARALPVHEKGKSEGRQEGAEAEDLALFLQRLGNCRQSSGQTRGSRRSPSCFQERSAANTGCIVGHDTLLAHVEGARLRVVDVQSL
jgi:tetratricopeptide (TPR) repeat protein